MKKLTKLQECILRNIITMAVAISALFVFMVSTPLVSVSAAKMVSSTDIPTKQGSSKDALNVSVTRKAPDLLLSNKTGIRKKIGAKFNRFLSSASYNGNYKENVRRFVSSLRSRP